MATLQHPFERKLDALSVRAARACVDIGLHGVEARVVAAFDMNPDMGPRYRSGFVHELATAVMALALRFDDDGIVPVWTFGRDAYFQGDMGRRDHVGFITRRILPPPPTGSGRRPAPSNFAPVIHRVGQHLFGAAWTPELAPPRQLPIAMPAFAIIFTSGDCADREETEAALRYASHFPIFWQFAGIPPEPPSEASFDFLGRVNALPGTARDSCGFFNTHDTDDMEPIFSGLLNEFPHWLTHADVRAMIDVRSVRGDDAGVRDPLDHLLALPADEEARRERERLEREQRRAARAVEEVQAADAWPRAGAATPGDPTTGEIDPNHRQARTRSIAPSHWRLEAIRERPWPNETSGAEMNAAASEAPETEAINAIETPETAAERLARIRSRRLERRFPLPPPRPGKDDER
jgi:hypothetical protein